MGIINWIDTHHAYLYLTGALNVQMSVINIISINNILLFLEQFCLIVETKHPVKYHLIIDLSFTSVLSYIFWKRSVIATRGMHTSVIAF